MALTRVLIAEISQIKVKTQNSTIINFDPVKSTEGFH